MRKAFPHVSLPWQREQKLVSNPFDSNGMALPNGSRMSRTSPVVRTRSNILYPRVMCIGSTHHTTKLLKISELCNFLLKNLIKEHFFNSANRLNAYFIRHWSVPLSGKTLQRYEKYMTFANEILKMHKIYARKYKF